MEIHLILYQVKQANTLKFGQKQLYYLVHMWFMQRQFGRNRTQMYSDYQFMAHQK